MVGQEKNTRVMVDIDDVLSQMEKRLKEEIKRGLKIKRYKEPQGTLRRSDDEKIREEAANRIKDPNFFLSVRPHKDALKGIVLLHEYGYKIYIVTARIEDTIATTMSWLETEGFAPYIEKLHQRPNSGKPIRFKVEKTIELGVATAFEDDPAIAQLLVKSGIPVRLIRRPWNHHLTSSGLLIPHSSFYNAAKAFCLDKL